MTTRRRIVAPALAAALVLTLGGCGSHHDEGPQLHGAGSGQNAPSQAPMAVGGNPTGMTASGGSVNGTPTPNAARGMEFNGGSVGGSTATRATPAAGLGMVPGAGDSGGGMGIFPTAAPG